MATAADEGSINYTELIMEAISSLGAASMSAISNYIETKNSELPQEHDSLLAEHLDRMKESGELLFIDENYSKPGATAPPQKRGRGRPPKPKDPLAAAVAKAASGYPRPRGRPRKATKPTGSSTPTPAPASAATSVGVKRARGRPPKAKPAVVSEAV